MRWRKPIDAGLLLGLLMVVASLAPAPGDDTKSRQMALANERIAVCRKALEFVDQKIHAGQSTGEESLKWSRRLVEATRQAGLPKVDVVRAIRDALKLAEASVARAKAAETMGSGSILDVLEKQDALLEIKIELEQAEAK